MTIADLEKLGDRDILINIWTTVDALAPRVTAVEDRVRQIELTQANQRGAFAGAKGLWTFLIALPPTVIAALFAVAR